MDGSQLVLFGVIFFFIIMAIAGAYGGQKKKEIQQAVEEARQRQAVANAEAQANTAPKEDNAE